MALDIQLENTLYIALPISLCQYPIRTTDVSEKKRTKKFWFGSYFQFVRIFFSSATAGKRLDQYWLFVLEIKVAVQLHCKALDFSLCLLNLSEKQQQSEPEYTQQSVYVCSWHVNNGFSSGAYHFSPPISNRQLYFTILWNPQIQIKFWYVLGDLKNLIHGPLWFCLVPPSPPSEDRKLPPPLILTLGHVWRLASGKITIRFWYISWPKIKASLAIFLSTKLHTNF